MKIDPLVQLIEILRLRGYVAIEHPASASEYEVTVWDDERRRDHDHYGGRTISEAINRAWKATVPQS